MVDLAFTKVPWLVAAAFRKYRCQNCMTAHLRPVAGPAGRPHLRGHPPARARPLHHQDGRRVAPRPHRRGGRGVPDLPAVQPLLKLYHRLQQEEEYPFKSLQP